MRFPLKSLILAPVFVAALALTTTSALADTTVKVPFSFTAAGQNWPAGTYIVSKNSAGNFLTMRGTKSTKGFTLKLSPGDAKPTDTGVTLKFDDVDGMHVLKSVQYGSMMATSLDHEKGHTTPEATAHAPGD